MSLSIRQHRKLLAAALEVMEEVAEVQREAAQAFGTELVAALERCKDGPGCGPCMAAEVIVRRHANSVAIAQRTLAEFMATQARKVLPKVVQRRAQ